MRAAAASGLSRCSPKGWVDGRCGSKIHRPSLRTGVGLVLAIREIADRLAGRVGLGPGIREIADRLAGRVGLGPGIREIADRLGMWRWGCLGSRRRGRSV
jgi:hypothetical protein